MTSLSLVASMSSTPPAGPLLQTQGAMTGPVVLSGAPAVLLAEEAAEVEDIATCQREPAWLLRAVRNLRRNAYPPP